MRRLKVKDPSVVTRYELDFVRPDGTVVPVELSSQFVAIDGQPHEILAVARDISERRAREAVLRDQAERDPLTGLPNRARLLQELQAAIAEAGERRGALAMVDLDRLKQINDTLGHEAGDQVLTAVARAMAQAADGHTVARMSGDEFVVLMRGVDDEQATEVAERVRLAVAYAHVLARGERVHPQISVGVATIEPGSTPAVVLATADAALYEAKQSGRNRVIVGAPVPFRRRDRNNFAVAEAVFEAIADDRLELVYQPIVDLASGLPVAHEALVRMRTPEGAVLMPSQFLPAMEQVGAVPTIDRCVAALVLQALRRQPDLRLFMNVSPSTLADATLFEYLDAAFDDDPTLAARLEVEITEAAAVLDVESTRTWLQRMRDRGCGLALDDFGTGYSFLYLVRDLPITTIKIDGSSIQAFVEDPRERALVRSLQTLADGLGLKTVAEWVETPEQLSMARALGITMGQGFLLGRPVRVPLTKVRRAA
jgi:diguanylate cyclase (GGDEF)-like protein